jgi:hypothetical protein
MTKSDHSLKYKQAFRKYSHSLGPDSLAYLEEIVVKYAIPDDEVEASIEFIAKEYNRQDGMYICCTPDT